eukprot:Tbor_TRINITY_DN5878_c0_g2::TRINITY_DN5878_c0_g2_i1::g.7080::m.7080
MSTVRNSSTSSPASQHVSDTEVKATSVPPAESEPLAIEKTQEEQPSLAPSDTVDPTPNTAVADDDVKEASQTVVEGAATPAASQEVVGACSDMEAPQEESSGEGEPVKKAARIEPVDVAPVV